MSGALHLTPAGESGKPQPGDFMERVKSDGGFGLNPDSPSNIICGVALLLDMAIMGQPSIPRDLRHALCAMRFSS